MKRESRELIIRSCQKEVLARSLEYICGRYLIEEDVLIKVLEEQKRKAELSSLSSKLEAAEAELKKARGVMPEPFWKNYFRLTAKWQKLLED